MAVLVGDSNGEEGEVEQVVGQERHGALYAGRARNATTMNSTPTPPQRGTCPPDADAQADYADRIGAH